MDTAELTAILQEVRDRVRARHPESASGTTPLPDLMPLLHARDAAEAKVAAIGTVNPRRGGPMNWIAQQAKKMIARALDWHVREQVEFNRNVIACITAALEALEDTRRVLALMGEIQELKDMRTHWVDWRQEWEHKLVENETKLLHGVAELNAAFQYRTGLMESSFREQVKAQHVDFSVAMDRRGLDIQQRLWADLEQIKLDYERLIYRELRVVRQRYALGGTAPVPAATAPEPKAPAFDYGQFAERFRGSEDYVKQGQRFYLPFFAGRREVLDTGCGRGEFLELMRDAGIAARGIDLGEESIALCRRKGLTAERADLFAYLAELGPAAVDGIFSSQVVEHLPPERLPEMIRLAAEALEPGGVLAIETPNPECLAIFARHFYLDPTHARPIPHPLLVFYMEELGFGRIEVHPRSPAVESMPSLASLPEDFRNDFFGGLDYAVIGRKL